MGEPFDIKKVFDFSFPTMSKCVGTVVKGLLILIALAGVIAGLWWGIYVVAVKPHIHPIPTSTTNQSGNITNNYINPTADELVAIIDKQVKKQRKKVFIGGSLFGWDVGISKQ